MLARFSSLYPGLSRGDADNKGGAVKGKTSGDFFSVSFFKKTKNLGVAQGVALKKQNKQVVLPTKVTADFITTLLLYRMCGTIPVLCFK